MMGRSVRPKPCENMNHRRANAPVGHCPQCGGVVNGSVRATTPCSEDNHAAARKRQAAYCVHCGVMLIAPR
jgi:hypothetical protein